MKLQPLYTKEQVLAKTFGRDGILYWLPDHPHSRPVSSAVLDDVGLPWDARQHAVAMTHHQNRDLRRLRDQLQADTYEKGGALHWKSNDAVVPMDVFRDAALMPPPAQEAAREADAAKFIAEYKKRRANHKPSAEEMFEMRAAFGPGQTVVDVITGKKFRT